MKKNAATPKRTEARRSYRQGARAEQAEATAARLLESFIVRLTQGWFEEIRLEDVAGDAGVTVQTVIRRFGGKEGVLAAAAERMSREIEARRAVPAGDAAAAIRAVLSDYEATGDLVMRLLAQEERYPAIRSVTDLGRAYHRGWLGEVFAPRLATLSPARKRATLDALVVATDLYVWKLVRRDMGRPLAEVKSLMHIFVEAALARAAHSAKGEVQ